MERLRLPSSQAKRMQLHSSAKPFLHELLDRRRKAHLLCSRQENSRMPSNPHHPSLRPIRKIVVIVAFVSFGITGFAVLFAQQSTEGTAPKPETAQIARGKYIVEDVAVCGQCHTPRAPNSIAMDSGHPLAGSALWLQSARPVSNWPLEAPRLATTLPGTDDEMVRLLTTGIWRDGNRLRAPMPQFRLSREDAEAVVSYLKSLPQSEK